MFTVRVYIDDVLFDQDTFTDEKSAIDFASDYQDRGYKVRMSW